MQGTARLMQERTDYLKTFAIALLVNLTTPWSRDSSVDGVQGYFTGKPEELS